MANVTVLGLGAMGSRMAVRLLDAGHRVTVWNRSPDRAEPLAARGALVAASPGEGVEDAEFAIAMLRDDEASREIWLGQSGALAGLPGGAIAIESSTLTVGWVRELSERCQAHGTLFLDAPVAGSRPQAEAGQLIHLVGGEAGVVARAEPVLKAMGGALHHAGPAGSGAALKLALNTLFGIQVASVAELLPMLRRAGVDAERAIDILGQTPVMSPAAKGAAAGMLARAFAAQFPVELVEKDFGYLLAAAGNAPLSKATRAVFKQAMDHGFGDDNLTGVIRLYEAAGQSD